MKCLSFSSILIALVLLTVNSCKLESSSFQKQDVFLYISGWELPDTAKVSTPFNIALSSGIDNSCIHNLQFVISNYDAITFRVYAQATYINHGEDCYDVVVPKDTVISGNLSEIGKYYFLFLQNNYWIKDSIIIIP